MCECVCECYGLTKKGALLLFCLCFCSAFLSPLTLTQCAYPANSFSDVKFCLFLVIINCFCFQHEQKVVKQTQVFFLHFATNNILFCVVLSVYVHNKQRESYGLTKKERGQRSKVPVNKQAEF